MKNDNVHELAQDDIVSQTVQGIVLVLGIYSYIFHHKLFQWYIANVYDTSLLSQHKQHDKW